MADDRIYLKCSTCESIIRIMSTFDCIAAADLGHVKEWLDEHYECHKSVRRIADGSLIGPQWFGDASDWFTLITEHYHDDDC